MTLLRDDSTLCAVISSFEAAKVTISQMMHQFHSSKQAQVAINTWLRQYNKIRPHHALGMRPPVPETLLENAKISDTEKWG